jgi:hypothetical protein
MKKIKLLLIIVLILNTKVLSLLDYNDYENTSEQPLKHMHSSYNNNNTSINEDEGEEEEDAGDDYDEETCSIDTFIDEISGKILPDDYEEGKQLEIKFGTESLNETIAIILRLYHYTQNVSEKLQPYVKRIVPRFAELLPLIDLPSDCLASLATISDAIQDGQQWAFKCKIRIRIKIN